MSLELRAVSKTYPGRRGGAPVQAVRDLDLAVQPGEIVALLGSSGCGKTSTLRMVAGFEAVSAGGITLAGKQIEALPPARRGVAMAFEGYALYPPLTVRENIAFGLGGRGGEAGRRRVAEVAELLGIAPLMDRKPAALSGGEQQRAGLARALVRDAHLHLLDEPMGQLEPQLRAVLRGRVKALIKERGLTAVLVTHDQAEAHAMADRIAVMEAGELQQFGPAAALRDAPANLFVATFFGEPPMNAIPAIAGPGGLRLRGADGEVAPDWCLDLPAPVTEGEVVLGVRPGRLWLGEGPWRGTVVSNQWLGDQAHVALEVCGRLLVAVSLARVPARIGEGIALGLDPAEAHLFEAGSGRALAHGGRRV
jgi:multiple sugar transport system ATP-binding protein